MDSGHDAKNLPDFLVIGAGKAGTTSLYHYLSLHLDIFLTPQKETRFFALEGEDLASFRWAGAKPRGNFSSIVSFEAYQQQFQGRTNEAIAGEVCPIYLYYPGTARRIARYVPQIKLIAILRNPADRAYSHYQFLRQRSREPLTFAEAVAREPERIRQKWMWDYHYTAQGFYHRQLRAYYDLFPPEQIKVFLFEDLKAAPQQLMADLFGFLGISQDKEIDVSQQRNVTRLPTNRLAAALYRQRHLWASLLKIVPSGWKQRLQSLYTERLTETPEPMDLAMRAQLVDLYGADIEALASLIGRDLSAWMKVS